MSHSVRLAIWALAILLIGGTVLFHQIEGWTWVDSFYFTGVSVLTIGYGDLTPTHDLSKILTVILGFGAVGVGLYAISTIGAALNHRIAQLATQLPFRTNSNAGATFEPKKSTDTKERS